MNHLLKMAGSPKLMNPPLWQTLCEHAAGKLRRLILDPLIRLHRVEENASQIAGLLS